MGGLTEIEEIIDVFRTDFAPLKDPAQGIALPVGLALRPPGDFRQYIFHGRGCEFAFHSDRLLFTINRQDVLVECA